MNRAEGEELDREAARYRCFDAHSDLLFRVIRERSLGRTRVIAEDFLPGMREGGVDGRVAAIYLDDEYVPELALRRALDIVEALHQEVAETEDLRLATTVAEVNEAWATGAYPLILGMEGSEPLKEDLSLVNVFYRLGLRLITLTHSRRNMVGDGSFFFPTAAGTPGGLSSFGVDVVQRMNELGMVVDVSHLNEPGFWDVLEWSDDPVIASHSNCRDLWDHPRNLTDEQIEALTEADGVLGLNAVGVFLAESDATIDDVLDHLDHAVDVAGVEHVGLGFDFMYYITEYLSERELERLPDLGHPDQLASDADVKNLVPAMMDRGYDDQEIEGVLRNNVLRLFETILDE